MPDKVRPERATSANREIWNAIYGKGSVLLYPSEIFVRLFFRHGREAIRPGMTMLDHGAGSGNNTEFLIRRGLRVVATDISQAALESIRQRFRYANLPFPETRLIDPARPLSEQLPECDAAVSWDCLCYNTAERARQDIADIIGRIRPGGLFFLSMVKREHDFISDAEEIAPGTYRYRGSARDDQEGAIFCAPESIEELESWCVGTETVAAGEFSYHDQNRRSENYFLVCRRK